MPLLELGEYQVHQSVKRVLTAMIRIDVQHEELRKCSGRDADVGA
jgi:hypothetical protein